MDETENPKNETADLKKMSDFKTDLISISAHELRTSLVAIRWILAMFKEKDFGPLTKEQEAMISRAYESSGRMADIVAEMLSINHGKTDVLRFSFAENDIVALVESILFDFSGESYKNGIQIIFLKPESAIPSFVFDKEKIRVVIQNLIENAIRYSEKGDKVFVSVVKKDDSIEVSVKDTGIGIDPANSQHIFEKLFRADNAKAKEALGSGLGLYTSKMIIEKHHGKIWFESAGVDSGTTFSFSLPLGLPLDIHSSLPTSN